MSLCLTSIMWGRFRPECFLFPDHARPCGLPLHSGQGSSPLKLPKLDRLPDLFASASLGRASLKPTAGSSDFLTGLPAGSGFLAEATVGHAEGQG